MVNEKKEENRLLKVLVVAYGTTYKDRSKRKEGEYTMKETIIRDIMKVFAVGGVAAGLGAVAIGLAYMAAWIVFTIPMVCGYAAVALFWLATLTIAAVLAVVYVCGCWIVRKGKFSK